MVGQSDALRDRYEDLERRKRSEAEGYQSDVKLLQQKMRRIETQLGRAAISKAKGKSESDEVGEEADLQGDQSACSLGVVDIKTKVAF